jgi:lipocalin
VCVVRVSQVSNSTFIVVITGPIAGTYTKNSASDVNNMMSKLNQWSIGNRPSVAESTMLSALKAPLTATTVPIDIQKFMGKWHVVANIPLSLELGASNYLESYSWNPKTETINVLCEYIALGGIPTAPKSCSKMHAKIMNAPINSYWALNPKVLGVYLPIGLTFLILDVAEDGSYALIGVPNRQNLWVLTRLKPTIKEGGQYKKIASTLTDEGSVAEATVFDDDSDERNSLPLGPAREASELDLEMEDAIMWRALAKARELGYDDERVLAVKWTV